MRITGFILALALSTSAVAEIPALDDSENPWSLFGPYAVGREMFEGDQFADLEKLVTELLKSRARMVDGRLQLDLLEGGIEELINQKTSMSPGSVEVRLQEWRRQNPTSALLPIYEAMNLHAQAWQARGEGYASEVTPEGWKTFRECDEKAWKLLMGARQSSSQYPAWYALAMSVAFELLRPREELDALFNESISKFPGQLSLYFSFLFYLRPSWGGSFEEIGKFVDREVASKNNRDGAALYARLYWYVDECDSCAKRTDLGESNPDWKRMRSSFEELLNQFPESRRNLAAYTDFACRADDPPTYLRLRARVDPEVFATMSRLTIQECDARFAQPGRHKR